MQVLILLAQSNTGVTEAAEVMGQVLGARLEQVMGLALVLLALFTVGCLILGLYAVRSINRFLGIHESTVNKVGGLTARIEKLEDETAKFSGDLNTLAVIAQQSVTAMQTVATSLVDAKQADVERTASNNRNYAEILRLGQVLQPLSEAIVLQVTSVDALKASTEEGFDTVNAQLKDFERTLEQMDKRIDGLIDLFKADQVSRNVAVSQTAELKTMVTAMLDEMHKLGTGPLPSLPDNPPDAQPKEPPAPTSDADQSSTIKPEGG